MTYSDSYLLNILKRYKEENDRTPTQDDFSKTKNTKYPSYMTYVKRFGTWNKALEMAGLCVNMCHHDNLSDEELLNYLVKFKEKNGRTPINDDFENNQEYPSHRTYVNRFGSWNKSLELAGLSVNRYINIPEHELLSYLTEFHKENGKVPTQRDFLDNIKYPNFNTYIYRFGSWNDALEKANLSINQLKHTNFSDDELLKCLLQFNNENGLIPSSNDFKNNSKYPNYGTYMNRFGSWTNALKMVSLDVDSTTKLNILDNNYQKGRQAEIMVINHFKNSPTDLSGMNCLSHCDGICPNGMTYDVKSSKLHNIGNGVFHFDIRNKYKEKIEIFYCLGFNENRANLIYSWRIPNDIINNDYLKIHISPSEAKFNTNNMKKFEITDKVKEFIKDDVTTNTKKVDIIKPQKTLFDF